MAATIGERTDASSSAPRPPSTSAAPVSLAARDDRSHVAMARELAVDLEGRRRSLTLGGSLLVIPATGGVTLAVSAAIGVPSVWLPVCTLAGLAIGLSLSAVTMAVSNLVGGAAVQRRFWRQARALGLGDAQIDQVWRDAESELDQRSRARLIGGRGAMVTVALDERTPQR